MLRFCFLAAFGLALFSGIAAPVEAAPGHPATVAAHLPAAGGVAAQSGPAAVVLRPTTGIQAANSVNLSGVVTDDTDNPLPGAAVWVTGHPQQMAITNASGEFTLVLPNNQAVQISCAYAGYQEVRIALPSPGTKKDFYVTLQPVSQHR